MVRLSNKQGLKATVKANKAESERKEKQRKR